MRRLMPDPRCYFAVRAAHVVLLILAGSSVAAPVRAAGPGEICCADLEDRIAELESAAGRKARRKVELAVSGQVSQAILFWDDGHERDGSVVGNKNDQSSFSFSGGARIGKELRAGFVVTIRLRDNLSDELSQTNDDGAVGFSLWESFWFIESKTWGRLSLGQASRVSDTAPENDLSATVVAGHAGIQDLGAGFFLRTKSGALSGVTLGDLYNHFNGDTANVVRYDTPDLNGLVLSASYGEDTVWDAGAKFEGSFDAIKLAASVAYTHATDVNGLDGGGDVAHRTLVGSVALLHEPSGLNALVAAGRRSFDDAVVDLDGVDRRPQDASFLLMKFGWIAQLTALGPTALYFEWGRFSDYVTATEDFTLADVGSLGGGVRIAGNRAEFWGLGVVQHIEAARMQFYLGYRHRDFEFDLVDGAGLATASEGFQSFQTLVVGSKISF